MKLFSQPINFAQTHRIEKQKHKNKTNNERKFHLTTKRHMCFNGIFVCDLFGFNFTPIQNIAFCRCFFYYYYYDVCVLLLYARYKTPRINRSCYHTNKVCEGFFGRNYHEILFLRPANFIESIAVVFFGFEKQKNRIRQRRNMELYTYNQSLIWCFCQRIQCLVGFFFKPAIKFRAQRFVLFAILFLLIYRIVSNDIAQKA